MKNQNLPRFLRVCAIAVAAFGGIFAVIGCDKGTPVSPAVPNGGPAAGGTGIVDLEKVADAVGWNSEIRKDTDSAKAELTRQVTVFAKDVTDKVAQHKTDLKKSAKLSPTQIEDLDKNTNLDKLNLTKEQLNMLVLILQNGQRAIQEAEQIASQVLQRRAQEIQQSYFKAVQPIVRQVAESQNMSVVLMKQTAFHNAASVEITDKVTDAVRANPPKITYPSMPDMKLPPVNLGEIPKPATLPATNPSASSK